MKNNFTITVDRRKFDSLQIRLLEEIASDIMHALKEADLEEEDISELTEKLTFGIAAIVDGSRVMDHEGTPVLPVLTFATNAKKNELLSSEGGSWMHEYAIGMAEKIIEKDGATASRIWMLRIEFEKPKADEVGAYMVGVDMAKSEKEILDELADDYKKFKRAKLPMDKVADVFLIQPSGARIKYDATAIIKKGFPPAALYDLFREADKKG